MFKKIFKWTAILSILGLGGLIAIQFDPVRDALKKVNFPL